MIVEFPCDIGETLYFINNNKVKNGRLSKELFVDTAKVASFKYDGEIIVNGYNNNVFVQGILNDTYFSSREEAEKALKMR